MHLYYKSYGRASLPPLVILHGLFGSSDNWHSFGRKFGEHYYTLIPDARNHGRSPHDVIMNYQSMAEDVREFLSQLNLSSSFLLGHSMGGKTAALVALLNPDIVQKLIVVDIAPRSYPPSFDTIIGTLRSLDLKTYETRYDVDHALSGNIHDIRVRQFLMKNLTRNQAGLFQWKMNLEIIEKNAPHINGELPQNYVYDKSTLFLCGENSNYIQKEDIPAIQRMFPRVKLTTIKNAGHWLQVDSPEEFFKSVVEFLSF